MYNINVEDKSHDPMIITNCSHVCKILILCTYVFFFVSIDVYRIRMNVFFLTYIKFTC